MKSPSPFKFNLFWLEEEEYQELVKKEWVSFNEDDVFFRKRR
jgi:hypothetical protein